MFLSVTQARDLFNKLISSGVTVLITKNKKTKAVLLRYDEYIRLLSCQRDVWGYSTTYNETSLTDYIKAVIKRELRSSKK